MADRHVHVGLPRLWKRIDEGEQVVRTEHVDTRAPQLGVAAQQREGHEPAIAAPHHTEPVQVEPTVATKRLDACDMVESVGTTPVPIDLLGVRQPVAGRPAHVRNEDGESAEREQLDERHREPGEVGPLLALRPSVDVVDHRERTRMTGGRGR